MDTKIRIKTEKESPVNSALCLVEFSNGRLKKARRDVKFDMYRKSVASENNKRILVASTGWMMYSGTNYQSNMFGVTSSLLKVAVLNKRTQRFKLYDVEYFRLKPIFKCDIFDDKVLESNAEQNQNLTLEFGGKSKVRGITSKLKLQSIEANKAFDEILLQKASEISIPSDIKPLHITSAPDDILPPVNTNASSPSEVYNIFDIIPKELFSALESEIEIFKDITYETLQTWKKESKFSDIIIYYLEVNFHTLTSDNANTMMLCYIQYLIIFINVKYTDLKKKDPLPEIPQPCRQNMMNKYLINRSFPQRMKDKLLADLIVLCLHLFHFCVDSLLLASSTKIGVKRLVNIAYALGCYVHSSKGDNSKKFELKLPLYKHEPFRSKKRM